MQCSRIRWARARVARIATAPSLQNCRPPVQSGSDRQVRSRHRSEQPSRYYQCLQANHPAARQSYRPASRHPDQDGPPYSAAPRNTLRAQRREAANVLSDTIHARELVAQFVTPVHVSCVGELLFADESHDGRRLIVNKGDRVGHHALADHDDLRYRCTDCRHSNESGDTTIEPVSSYHDFVKPTYRTQFRYPSFDTPFVGYADRKHANTFCARTTLHLIEDVVVCLR